MIATGYEIGFVALAVGWLCGMGVVLMSKGQKGVPLQIIAAVASVLGILVGKYISFYDALKTILAQEGAELSEEISIFSMKMIQFFIDNLSSIAGGFDILWIVLAIVIAWSLPKASGIKLAG